jgi:hypothetical protein
MPFTRNPLEYPINRLIVHVGMQLEIWIRTLPPVKPNQRTTLKYKLVDYLGLEQAVRDGLIKKYRFKWRRCGQVKTIWLIPGDKVRRTPGLPRLRDLFLRK